MSETETPAERRLRDIEKRRHNGYNHLHRGPERDAKIAADVAAIDMGREALELIRTMPTASMSASWWDKRRDLLARAGDSE